jgi:hypothetical protein
MSNSNTHVATRLKRCAAMAALWVFTVATIVACDGTGSGLIGTGGQGTPNAALRSLTTSSGTLTPVFDSATTSYSALVSLATASITVSPVAVSTASIVTVNGTVVPSGGTSPSIPLAQGATTQVLVRVTASDSLTVRTYAILVVRPTT